MSEQRDPAGPRDGLDHQPGEGAGARKAGWAVWVRAIALAAVVAVAVLVAAVVGVPDVERLRADVASAGAAAPALFVVLYAVATLAPLPKNVLSTLERVPWIMGRGRGARS
ncbi:hypothetical protein [Pseudonocardia nigra]|uniref:hypothetical protein n=1 Tax=Pseudonocardia nigra TaxID=1921578 RepID=UPI001C5F21A2|nr:hypothetical protein [Pseudonocardia nigra]